MHPVDAATLEYLKVIIAPLSAVFIAAVGWALTSAYNKTQFTIAEAKNQADVEVARINAALSFANTYRQIPDTDILQKDQAVAIAAPVLSPELAFDLAIKTVSRDQNILKILLAKYGDDSWDYVTPALEIVPLDYNDPTLFTKRKNDSQQAAQSFAEYETTRAQAEVRARCVLAFLDQQQHHDGLVQYIVSDHYKRPQLRAYALLQVFQYLDEKMQYPANTASEVKLMLARIRAMLGDPLISDDAKVGIAIAAALTFDRFHSRLEFTDLAVPYFWKGIAVDRGETPSEYDLRSYVYRDRFHYPDVYGKTVTLPQAVKISGELTKQLKELRFRELDSEQIDLILYSYVESSPHGAPTPFTAYLTPQDAFDVLQLVVASLDSGAKKRDFANHLGSLSGDHLFRNISEDKKAGRRYAELIIDWYGKHYQKDWNIPKFFSTVIAEFPDLAPRINTARYGIPPPDPANPNPDPEEHGDD